MNHQERCGTCLSWHPSGSGQGLCRRLTARAAVDSLPITGVASGAQVLLDGRLQAALRDPANRRHTAHDHHCADWKPWAGLT